MLDVALQGNPVCWFKIFTYDYCCHVRHGPGGNPDCWDETFKFEGCCLTPAWLGTPEAKVNAQGAWRAESLNDPRADGVGDSCWDEAKRHLSASGDAVAEHPALADEANLAKLCCWPTAFSSQVCWGADRPGGSRFVRDSASGDVLNFTERYAECCFPALRHFIAGDVPEWMSAQLDEDLGPWERQKADLGTDEFDAFEARAQAAGFGDKLCRFRVRRPDVFHCDFKRMAYDNLLHAVRNALHVLLLVTNLPDVEFLVYAEEYYGVGGHELNEMSPSVPVLVQARPAGLSGLLMPWWAFLQLDWTRLYGHRLQRTSANKPWADRTASLFWRGSDTGCLLPGSCGPMGCACENWTRHTWPRFPRSKLVLSSTLMPERIDARYTKDVVHWDCAETYDAADLWLDEIVPPEKHVAYKYLMYIDGLSFSDRLYWLMLTRSLVFRASSQLRVWLDAGLQPWVHFVPVAENMTDLVDRLDWARQNDAEAAEIAARGSAFAAEQLSLDGSLYYLFQLLARLAVTAAIPPSAPLDEEQSGIHAVHRPLRPAPRPRNAAAKPVVAVPSAAPMQEDDAKSLECWAFGYTPEFCCNIDQFGEKGNEACWDGPYSFGSCCVGPLGKRSFWEAREAMISRHSS